jgi:hypothetical protein
LLSATLFVVVVVELLLLLLLLWLFGEGRKDCGFWLS